MQPTHAHSALIYDIEIVKAIPHKNGQVVTGIDYCAGWHDHANMGISVICAYDYESSRYRVFCADNFSEFLALRRDRLLVGFNNIAFDEKVIGATLGTVPAACTDCYDLLREIWLAAGLNPEFSGSTHAGFGLDAVCRRNFNRGKTGHGAMAPVQWQKGEIGSVIDYCMQDVHLTKLLFDRVLSDGTIVSPKDGNRLWLKSPYPGSVMAKEGST